MPKFASINNMPEDDRIILIGKTCMSRLGQPGSGLIGFLVEDSGKADRYVEKLTTAFPRLRVVDRNQTPGGTVLVRIEAMAAH